MTRRNQSIELGTSDLDLFNLVVRDVKPLKSTPVPIKPGSLTQSNQGLTKKQVKGAKTNVSVRDLGPDPNPKPSPIPISKHPVGKVPGIDRRTALRLKRGKSDIEGKIDLHGMNRKDAHAALIRFIEYNFQEGRRTVLVITGKGNRKDRTVDNFAKDLPGVLRRMLPKWLSEPPVVGQVLAFSPARPEHGGLGAFYVLLKRKSRR